MSTYYGKLQDKDMKPLIIYQKISYTFVSGLFMVYTKFLTELEGVYFVDPPPITWKNPYNQHIAPFSQLLAKDIWKLLSP
jgi:hypothetical protein